MDCLLLLYIFVNVRHKSWFDVTANCPLGRTAADTVEAIIAQEINPNSDTTSSAAQWVKTDASSGGYSEVNCVPKQPTAADTIDAIIAMGVGVHNEGMSGGAEWKKIGSQTSVCSDNTSDTLSADEGQKDEDETRPRRVRPEETLGPSASTAALPPVVDHIRNGCGPHILPISSSSGLGSGTFPFDRQGGCAVQIPLTSVPFQRNFSVPKPPDVRHILTNGDKQCVLPTGSAAAPVTVQASQAPQCVRDVIHSAIEKHIQSINPSLAYFDNIWQFQNRGLLPMPRTAVTADTSNELAQDLSCRSREPLSAAVKLPQAMRNCVSPPGAVRLHRADKSPPPAHSRYGRPPVTTIPPPPSLVIDRCQDPLYHLAEVAVQRGRVEVASDRHRSSPAPGAGAGYSGQPIVCPSVRQANQDCSGRGTKAEPAVGSITHGTPRHLMAAEMLSRPVVNAADAGSRNATQHSAKASDGLPTAPQVVQLAQEALRYLGPSDSSQRAVMERVMAQVAGSFASSNSTILMGDYVTAQQMQTSQHHLSLQPPNLTSQHYPHQLPADHRTGPRDHVSSPRVPDLVDSVRMNRDISVNHAPVVHLPERPRPATHLSPLIRRPLTAANVIDAIITHHIGKEAPVSTSTVSVFNQLPDPQALSSSSVHRVMNVSGPVHPGTVSGPVVYPPPPSIVERLEKEHGGPTNSHPAAMFRNQDLLKGLSSVTSVVSRPVTLGEHIEKMIQKDFSVTVYDKPTQVALDVSRNGELISFLFLS